ncbi:MAG TPA: 2-dehydro-3-deoxy-6-phosphogalactonate aldolase [Casimicrobiaceae bacterium]|nr:2-dehydro-3-deoxy-6-phosphogalactonate aldolase [Casimicrobiaceae bacterium]
MNKISLQSYLRPLPLIAVLRGITPAEIDAVGAALIDNGFRILEVPLNSPAPFDSIARLERRFGEHCLTGAGTVIKVTDVAKVAAAGGKLIVMPHGDVEIVREAKRLGMLCVPGVATPTEAFAALDAGADGLKMFPAEQLSPAALKAWRAVLPKGALVFPVGGIRPDNMTPYWEVGADGFGTGSNLYTPGATADTVREAAVRYAAGFASLNAR